MKTGTVSSVQRDRHFSFPTLTKIRRTRRDESYQCRSLQIALLEINAPRLQGRIISLTPYEKELKHMRQKLDSEAGKRIYKRRQTMVEPVFATLNVPSGSTDSFCGVCERCAASSLLSVLLIISRS